MQVIYHNQTAGREAAELGDWTRDKEEERGKDICVILLKEDTNGLRQVIHA